jgi:hypothetical protein
MTLENKYNVSRETIKQMVNDGVISSSVVRHYEVYDHFKKLKDQCSSCTMQSLLERAATETHMSLESVRAIVYKLCKK